MAKALGVGGVFFKSKDPKGLASWYGKWLGFDLSEMPNATTFRPADMPAHGLTVWSAFGADTTYFDPAKREFMINLVVDDLDGALAQVREGGAQVMDDLQEEEYGRFGWFVDPEGNKVELGQPPAA